MALAIRFSDINIEGNKTTIHINKLFMLDITDSIFNTLINFAQIPSFFTFLVLFQVALTSRIAAETYGNGLTNRYDYQEDSGQLLNITTVKGNQAIRSLHYTYDRMDNVTSRYDAINNIREVYSYDQLDRLITNRVTGTNHQRMLNGPRHPFQ